MKRHGEHEGVDEGGYESKKALGDAWRGACAGDGNPGPREEVGGWKAEKWGGRTANTKAQKPER